jgi:hypothetical protein
MLLQSSSFTTRDKKHQNTPTRQHKHQTSKPTWAALAKMNTVLAADSGIVAVAMASTPVWITYSWL